MILELGYIGDESWIGQWDDWYHCLWFGWCHFTINDSPPKIKTLIQYKEWYMIRLCLWGGRIWRHNNLSRQIRRTDRQTWCERAVCCLSPRHPRLPRLLDIQFPLLILYSYLLLHTGHPNKKATYWSTYLNRFTWENDIRCQGLGRKDFQECKEFSQIDLMHRSCNVRKILWKGKLQVRRLTTHHKINPYMTGRKIH